MLRQPSVSTRTPPSTGPAESATLAAAVHRLIARPRAAAACVGQQGQRAGHEKSRSHSLDGARRSCRPTHRGEQQGRKGNGIGVNNPLQAGHADPDRRADAGERDVDRDVELHQHEAQTGRRDCEVDPTGAGTTGMLIAIRRAPHGNRASMLHGVADRGVIPASPVLWGANLKYGELARSYRRNRFGQTRSKEGFSDGRQRRRHQVFSCGNLARKSRPNSPCAAMPIGHQSQRGPTKRPEQTGSYRQRLRLSRATQTISKILREFQVAGRRSSALPAYRWARFD
jgi:hypothetical protein